jgi:hypothetical protein
MKNTLLLICAFFLISQISFGKEVSSHAKAALQGNYISLNVVPGIVDVSGGFPLVEVDPTAHVSTDMIFNKRNNAIPNFEFNNSTQVLGSDNPFFKMAKTQKISVVEKNRVWLNLTNVGGAFKQLLVGYIAGATNNWDNLYDAISYDANIYVDFYSINDGRNLVIQGRAVPFVSTDEVPLGYRTTIEGTFEISISKVDGLLVNQDVFVADKTTGVFHNLKTGPYSFSTLAGRFNDRFVLVYIDKTVIVTPPVAVVPPVVVDPIANEPIADLPVVTNPIVEAPVIVSPIVEEVVVANPIVETPVVTEPIISEPVIVSPIVEEVVVANPIVETPVVTEPIIPEPVIVSPIVEEVVVVNPIVETPVVTEPIISEPVIVSPIVEEVVVINPIAEVPVVTEPIIAEPVIVSPVVNEVVVLNPIIETPVVTEPIIPEPVIVSPVVDEVVVLNPIIETPVVAVPIISEPVIVSPIVEEVVVINPIIEIPVVAEPIIPEPVIVSPIVEEVMVINPIVETPVVAEPIIPEPVIVSPIVEEVVVINPIIEIPVVAEPIIPEPVIVSPIVEEVMVNTPIVETPVVAEAIAFEINNNSSTFGVGNHLGNKVRPVAVYSNNHEIKVYSSDENIDKVMVYNLAGRPLYEVAGINNAEFVISSLNSSNQFLIVRTFLKNGKGFINKIVF